MTHYIKDFQGSVTETVTGSIFNALAHIRYLCFKCSSFYIFTFGTSFDCCKIDRVVYSLAFYFTVIWDDGPSEVRGNWEHPDDETE